MISSASTSLLLATLAAWITLGAPRPRLPLAIGSVLAAGLVVAFPYTRFIAEPAKSDTFGLIPLWSVNEHLPAGSYRLTVLVAAVALVALFALVPAGRAVAVPLVLLGLFTRAAAFILSGEMAVAYFTAHASHGNVLLPTLNQGEAAVLYCFVFLFLAAAGGGAWSVDRWRATRPTSRSEAGVELSESRR